MNKYLSRLPLALALLILFGCATLDQVPEPVRFQAATEDPDAGGDEYVLQLGDVLDVKLFYNPELDETLPIRPDGRISLQLVGEVKGRRAIMYDDMIDTAGSVCNGAGRLLEEGAQAVRVFAAHGILSGEAVSRIEQSAIDLVTVTNTIPPRPETDNGKIRYISVAPILAEAIRRNHMGMSISSLFR